MYPYCFVITSFNVKEDLLDLTSKAHKNEGGDIRTIDFGMIYKELIEPAVKKAELEPLLESKEKALGIIHKTMYEKILLCEYCVTDLTNLNPNVYYELGMRYAVKPFSTVPIIASSHFPLPFDIGPNRLITYQVDDQYNLTSKENDINKLTEALVNAKLDHSTDSPIYDLVDGIQFQNAVAHEKTDIFRERVRYNEEIKEELHYARKIKDKDENIQKAKQIEAIDKVVAKYEPLENIETAVLIDMMISYRNIGAFLEMKSFIEELPMYVLETVLVQEQYAFVLNRVGGKSKPIDEVLIDKAEDILRKLERNKKASSETYGIWGRIYKDKFDMAFEANEKGVARVQLKKAKEYYQKGFEFDLRDAYPGVNYVTCLKLLGEEETALRTVPAVELAVETLIKRNKASGKDANYWDKATLLELAVVEEKYEKALGYVFEAKPLVTEEWMIETTTKNLEKIIYFGKERKKDVIPIENIIIELNKK